MVSRIAQAFKGLFACAAAIATVVAPPVALFRFVGNPLPGQLPTWQEFTDALARGGVSDEGVINVLAVLAWVVWVQVALAIVVEATAVARGIPSPRLPVLPGIQSLAANWLAAAALITSPLSGPAVPGAPLPVALTVAVDDAQPSVIGVTSFEAEDAGPARPPDQEVARPADQERAIHVVERHDSLWDIAERYLGDPFRWQEIRDLNVGRLQPDGQTPEPEFETIHPGWRLLVPVPAEMTGAGSAEYTVRPGDHLWGIAEEAVQARIGRSPTDDEVRPYWQDLIDENRGRLPDAADPGLIRPGLRITLPGDRAVPPPPPHPPPDAEPERPPEPATEVQRVPPNTTTTTTTPSTTTTPTTSRSPLAASNGRAHSHDDGGGSDRSIGPVLGIAGVALSTGVLAAVRRRQRRRSITAPRGHAAPPIPEEFDALRCELAAHSDEDGRRDLDAALATIGAHLAGSPNLRRRRPVLVQLGEETIDVLLDQPALPAPTGWQPQASGAVWTSPRPLADAPRHTPSPALVTVGQEGGVAFMLDLEAFGVITVCGNADDVAAFGRSILLELAHSASSDAIALLVVGAVDFDESDGVRRCASWAEAEHDVLAWARQSRSVLDANRLPNVFAARSSGKQLDGLAPLVVICEGLPAAESFTRIRELARGGAAVSVVALGAEPADGPHIRIDAGGLSIDAIGLRCRAQGVGADAVVAVASLLDTADRPVEQLAIFDEAEVIDLRDDDYVDPPHDVLVKVLGEIAVVGGHRPLTPKETAFFTFVALHDGCSGDRLEEAIWPAPMESRRRQVHNVASQVRTALGVDHLPASTDSRYSVGPRVCSDLDLLSRRVAYAASQPPPQAIDTLRGALDMVGGPAFGYRHADRGSYTWVDLEHWSITTEAKVVEVAWRLWELCQGEGDHDGAIWAARRGLQASPGNTELTEALMRAYVAAGDPEGAEDVFKSHAKVLDQLDQDEPAATTLELWQEIRSGDADARSPASS